METYEVHVTEVREWVLKIEAPAEWAAVERAQTLYDSGELRTPTHNHGADVRARWVKAA